MLLPITSWQERWVRTDQQMQMFFNPCAALLPDTGQEGPDIRAMMRFALKNRRRVARYYNAIGGLDCSCLNIRDLRQSTSTLAKVSKMWPESEAVSATGARC